MYLLKPDCKTPSCLVARRILTLYHRLPSTIKGVSSFSDSNPPHMRSSDLSICELALVMVEVNSNSWECLSNKAGRDDAISGRFSVRLQIGKMPTAKAKALFKKKTLLFKRKLLDSIICSFFVGKYAGKCILFC